MKTLDDLKEVLRKGQVLSMETSYDRRAPNARALPSLLEAREGLLRVVHECPDHREAWILLAEAEEALLAYSAARKALETALNLGKVGDKRLLKRLARVKEYEAEYKRRPEPRPDPEDLEN